MTQNIPLSDTFDQNGGWGGFLANYIRSILWNSGSFPLVGAYAVTTSEATLHHGYKAIHGGVSFMSTQAVPIADSFGGTVWRAFFSTDATAEAVFKTVATAGSATNDSFRQAAVGVRIQGGTVDNTPGHEHIRNHIGYWLFLTNTQAQGCLWSLVRTRPSPHGPVVLATEVPSPNTALAYVPALGRKLSLSIVTNVSGNPELTATTSLADGSSPVTLFGGPFADSDAANKITTAGRCGFGMTRDRAESGGVKTTTLNTYFRVLNGAGVEQLRDEWLRNLWHGMSGVSIGGVLSDLTDGNGISGKRSQQMWGGDIYGAAVTGSQYNTPEVDAANNRLKSEIDAGDVTGSKRTYMVACFGPTCGKCLDRSFVLTYVNLTTPAAGSDVENELFILSWDQPGDEFQLTPHAFRLYFDFDAAGGIGVLIDHLPSGATYTQIGSGGPLVFAVNTPLTFRWLVSVTGTAPTRVWKFELRLGGLQVPFIGPLGSGWTLNGDGSLNRLESVLGALLDTQSAGSLHWTRTNSSGSGGTDPGSDDYRLDSWSDTSPACCTTPFLLDTAKIVFHIAPPTLALITPTLSLLPALSLVYVIPANAITIPGTTLPGPPRNEAKFAGPVAVQGSFSGVVAGQGG